MLSAKTFEGCRACMLFCGTPESEVSPHNSGGTAARSVWTECVRRVYWMHMIRYGLGQVCFVWCCLVTICRWFKIIVVVFELLTPDVKCSQRMEVVKLLRVRKDSQPVIVVINPWMTEWVQKCTQAWSLLRRLSVV